MGRQDKQAQRSSSVGGKSRRLDAAKGSERWKSGREVMDGLCHWIRGKVISNMVGGGRIMGRDITTDAHFSYCSTCLLKHFSSLLSNYHDCLFQANMSLLCTYSAQSLICREHTKGITPALLRASQRDKIYRNILMSSQKRDGIG